MILLDFKWHLIDAFIPTTPNITTAGLDNSRIWRCWAFLQLKNRKLLINPNRHEGGHFGAPCPFWIRFSPLNFYQKFLNFFGGEN